MYRILLLFLLTSVFSTAWAGPVRHCGQLTSVALVAGQSSLVRMSLFDSKRSPSYVTIKDIKAIVETIRVLTGNKNYLHQSEKDNYDWSQMDTADRYFVCIESDKFRSRSERYFLDTTSELIVWKNRKMVFQRSRSILKKQNVSKAALNNKSNTL